MQEIRTEHLTVGYDKTPLIGDVNLSVRPGEILTLIGPNGSGKSTILKTITKQLKKLDGTVFLGEASMDELKDSQISRRLSMVMTERLRTELMSGRGSGCLRALSLYGKIWHPVKRGLGKSG